MLYTPDQKIDFTFIKEVLKKNSKDSIRAHTLNKCGFENFQKELRNVIKNLF